VRAGGAEAERRPCRSTAAARGSRRGRGRPGRDPRRGRTPDPAGPRPRCRRPRAGRAPRPGTGRRCRAARAGTATRRARDGCRAPGRPDRRGAGDDPGRALLAALPFSGSRP
jgi:hypothetical protein